MRYNSLLVTISNRSIMSRCLFCRQSCSSLLLLTLSLLSQFLLSMFLHQSLLSLLSELFFLYCCSCCFSPNRCLSRCLCPCFCCRHCCRLSCCCHCCCCPDWFFVYVVALYVIDSPSITVPIVIATAGAVTVVGDPNGWLMIRLFSYIFYFPLSCYCLFYC